LAGSVLVVEPLGIALSLPPEWFGGKDSVTWPPSCGHNVHGDPSRRLAISHPMLDSVRHATGEWDREYSSVVDSLLPFDALVAQVGPEPFSGGTCFADLQLRIYVLPTPDAWSAKARQTPLALGLRTAQGFFPSATLASRDSGEWHLDRLRWNAWYADYGAEANVQLYSTVVRDRTLFFVFLRISQTGGPAERDQQYILQRLRLP
jgi:hypothetical protein